MDPEIVPLAVDRRAQTSPNAIYAEYPVSTVSYSDGYRKITYRDLANASNGTARWLTTNLGSSSQEILAYIGPNDVRYPALIIGAAKAGYVLFLPSPRNSIAAQIQLLKQLDCNCLLSSDPKPPAVTALATEYDIKVLEVPPVGDLLDHEHQAVSLPKELSIVQSDPFFVIHTSGSTGIPKSLIYTYDTGLTNTRLLSKDPPPGFDSLHSLYQGKRVFLTFPPFHGAYLVNHLFDAIYFNTVMIAPISGAITSAQGLVEALKHTPVDVAFLIPSIVHELAQDPQLLDYCSQNLEAILYCGGDLPASIGDAVATKIPLFNQYGASELGFPAQLLPLEHERDRQDWKYARFHPDIGLELRHVDGEMHEVYAVQDPVKEHLQPTFTIFPNIQEYASRDLFVRHPSKGKEDMWSWKARADDIIVFLNGEKTNPISMEQYIVSQNPEVASALVIGAQRFQAAVLIEPVTGGPGVETVSERATLIERIWPTIAEANKDAPGHARIAKTHILFSSPCRPMIRAGKGTIQRAATLNSYAKEIDRLYKDADAMSAIGDKMENVTTDASGIRDLVQPLLDLPNIHDTDDFFSLGMDSLQALSLVRKLKGNVPAIAPSTIYTNPSITALTAAISRLNTQAQDAEESNASAAVQHRMDLTGELKAQIDRIPRSIPQMETAKSSPTSEVIILTGSTGTLGSHILQNLLSNPDVKHIYCLNRSEESKDLQKKRNSIANIPTDFPPARVTFLTVDLSRSNFFLFNYTFAEMSTSVTMIIHAAWPVNFNLSLDSFRPQLMGLVNLISFAAQSSTQHRPRRPPPLFFISSISSVMIASTSAPTEPIQETLDPNSAVSSTLPNGYASSKSIAEHLLDHAASTLNLPTSFVRVGQLAGPVSSPSDGVWNSKEWFPSLVTSSAYLHALPQNLGSMERVDWVPVDLAARVLIDMALKIATDITEKSSQEAKVLHLVNPHPIAWAMIRDFVRDELCRINHGADVAIVPPHKWLQMVQQDLEDSSSAAIGVEEALRKNPAGKMVEFYEGIFNKGGEGTVLEMERSLQVSSELGRVEGVGEEWIRKWVKRWFA